MTLLENPPSLPRHLDADGIIRMGCASWELYEILLRDRDAAHEHFKVTYNRGRLTIVSPSPTHEQVKSFLGRMVELADVERGLGISAFGSTTWKREDLLVGLESDECYYIGRRPHYEGTKPIDLTREPAPDLAIEVDISRHPAERLSIYQKLGVREVWRFDGKRVEIFAADATGQLVGRNDSILFSFITSDVLDRFVEMMVAEGDSAAILAFRDFLRSLPPPMKV